MKFISIYASVMYKLWTIYGFVSTHIYTFHKSLNIALNCFLSARKEIIEKKERAKELLLISDEQLRVGKRLEEPSYRTWTNISIPAVHCSNSVISLDDTEQPARAPAANR
jgi:hypothetical protein